MPIKYQFANFFDAELLVGISAGATSIMVTPTAAAILPVLGVDDRIQLTIWDGQQAPEIVTVTANDLSGTLPVLRGQEGTTAKAWNSGAQVVCTLTAAVINAALAAFYDISDVIALTFLPLAGGTLTGPLILADDPVDDLEAATKAYVDAILGDKLPLTGGTMSGDINMDSNHILGLPDTPVADNEAVPKAYLDAQVTAIQESVDNLLADISGELTSTGTSTALVVDPNQTVTANVDGFRISFRPHVASGAAPTLKVGTAPAAPIRTKAATAIPTGALLANFPYSFVYSNAQTAWLLVDAVDAMTLLTAVITTLTVSGIASFTTTSHLQLPLGTTAQRPGSPAEGMARFNSTLKTPEWYNATAAAWLNERPSSKVNGLVWSVASNITITVDMDDCVLVDTLGNSIKHLSPSTITINSTVTGLNGCDIGTRAANTGYYIWLISNGTTLGAILHAINTTAPTMPAGYTFKKLIGWTRTDGSSNFYRVRQVQDEAQYVLGTNPTAPPIVDRGAVGTYSSTSPTLNASSWTGFAPAIATRLRLVGTNFWGANGPHGCLVAPNVNWGGTQNGPSGSNGVIYPFWGKTAAGTEFSASFDLVPEATTLGFAGDGGGAACCMLGWTFPL